SVRFMVLILEDTPARIQRFEKALGSALPRVQFEIVNTADAIIELIQSKVSHTFAISLDHDLYVSGIDDPGDGLQVATYLSSKPPSCPVIIHTSNSDKSRQMQGVLESENWNVRLAGAIGDHWIESDWITEVTSAFKQANPSLP
ncbi:MAG: response regulator, partial [Planctomycetota bacterium]